MSQFTSRLGPLLCLALATSTVHADTRPPVDIPALRPAQAQDAALVAIDGQLRRGEWEAAYRDSKALLEGSKSVFHGALQRALVRLALVEAKLGSDEEARFHWRALQAMGGAELGEPLFGLLGGAGDSLKSLPSRAHGEVPAGVVELGGAAGVSPARRIEGELPSGDAGCTGARGPLWAKLEGVVDARGQLTLPTISGPSVCFSFEVLKAARHWSFEPARRDGVPVAAMVAETIHPPAGRKLAELLPDVPIDRDLVKLLEAGKLRAADKRLARQWEAALAEGSTPRRRIVAMLALKALVQAASDDADSQRQAGCLWEAAQAEEPGFYDLDLSAFGAAGQHLAAHRWGEARSQPIADAAPDEARTRPEVLRETWQRPRKRFENNNYGASHVFIEALVDEQGMVREPLLFERLESMRGLDLETLHNFCAVRFRPATIAGKPVASIYVLTLSL